MVGVIFVLMLRSISFLKYLRGFVFICVLLFVFVALLSLRREPRLAATARPRETERVPKEEFSPFSPLQLDPPQMA